VISRPAFGARGFVWTNLMHSADQSAGCPGLGIYLVGSAEVWAEPAGVGCAVAQPTTSTVGPAGGSAAP